MLNLLRMMSIYHQQWEQLPLLSRLQDVELYSKRATPLLSACWYLGTPASSSWHRMTKSQLNQHSLLHKWYHLRWILCAKRFSVWTRSLWMWQSVRWVIFRTEDYSPSTLHHSKSNKEVQQSQKLRSSSVSMLILSSLYNEIPNTYISIITPIN